MPSLGTIQYYVTIDVIYAEGFDMDNLYIEYTIKVWFKTIYKMYTL